MTTFVPADLLYRNRRYDFDASLVDENAVRRVLLPDLVISLLTNRLSAVEINEPLQLSGLPRAAAAIAAARIGGLLHRSRPKIASYAIENRDPFAVPPARARARARKIIERHLSSWVTARIDQVVFGTPGAAELYQKRLAPELRASEIALVPAIPSICSCVSDPQQDPISDSVLFVGALEDRKGILRLLRAWAEVERTNPQATLTIIGKGRREPEVRRFVSQHRSASFVMDPPRERIHCELSRHAALVLLSQPTATWREQVGLPIVEALAHGCRVVTTTETGLAMWLAERGHAVLSPSATDREVAAAIQQCLRTASRSEIFATLPALDGRLLADERLMGS